MNIVNITGGVSPIKARQKSRGGKRAGQATKTAKQRGGFAKSKGQRGAGGRNVGGYNVKTRFKFVKPDRDVKMGGKPSSDKPSTVKDPVPTPQKPYSIDDKGNVVINNNFNPTITNTNDPNVNVNVNDGGGGSETTETTTKKGREGYWKDKYKDVTTTSGTTYQQAWDDKDRWTFNNDGTRSDKYGNTYTNMSEFEDAAREYNKKTGHTTFKTETNRVHDGKEWVWGPETSETTTKTTKTNNNKSNVTVDVDDDSPATYKGKYVYGGYRAMNKSKN